MKITLADYRIISDSPFTLVHGQTLNEADKTFETFALENLAQGANFLNPFLSFQMAPLSDEVEYEIEINSDKIKSTTTNQNERGVRRVLQEPINGSLLYPNQVNKIQFQILKGKAVFGEVILHFQQLHNFKLN